MYILAFESSCDETSAAVVEAVDGALHVRSDIIASQVEIHRLYGGVVPEIASRAHIEAIYRITEQALQQADIRIGQVGLVAVTSHPGLIGALLVAVNFAKSLAARHNLPLVAVDHIKGHIGANYLDRPEGGAAPSGTFLALVVSGGHTALYRAQSPTKMTMVGTTRDDAIGEAFDKIGRLIGLPYPAGAQFDALAQEGFAMACDRENPTFAQYRKSAAYRDPHMALPSPALPGDAPDFSFSGLKTAAMNLLHRYEQTGQPLSRPLFAARFTYEAVDAVAKQTDAAIRRYAPGTLLVAGGVAANSHLRRRLCEVCEAREVRLLIPPPCLCGDNAAMIGAQGYYEYQAGHLADSHLNACAADEAL